MKKLLIFEGSLLSLAGLIHIIFLLLFVNYNSVDSAAYAGGMFFGIAYLVFGINFVKCRTRLLLLALIINVIGLTAVIIAGESSPLWIVDPYLIVIDIISIPTLIYLNVYKVRLINKK